MDYYPVFLRLRGRRVLLVGAGEVGLRKARALCEAGAELTVVSRSFSPEFSAWASDRALELLRRPFAASDVRGKFLVVAATDDEAANDRITAAAAKAGVWANVVDDPKRSSFIVPAVVDRSPLVVAVSTGGCAPVLAKLWKEMFEQWLPRSLGPLARFAGGLRERVKSRLRNGTERRRFWETFVRSPALPLIASGDEEGACKVAEDLMDGERGTGFVHIVGVGPGDPELITIKALQAMQQADVVLHDWLVSEEILSLCRKDARRLVVGKHAGRHGVTQEEINELMVDFARRGLTVCRLKGGDPFIFGRGAEEAEALVAAGIPYAVVPGITAAAGCGAYAGIPLTHRDFAHGVTFVTARCQSDGSDADWAALARMRQTLVVYMGLARCRSIAEALMRGGLPGATPAAAVAHGTTARQTVLSTRLDELADEIESQHLTSPVLLVIGEVASLEKTLGWFGKSSLRPQEAVPRHRGTKPAAYPNRGPDCAPPPAHAVACPPEGW